MINESVKKSLEKSRNVLEEKRKIVMRKICIKKTHVYNNCYELCSRAINHYIFQKPNNESSVHGHPLIDDKTAKYPIPIINFVPILSKNYLLSDFLQVRLFSRWRVRGRVTIGCYLLSSRSSLHCGGGGSHR